MEESGENWPSDPVLEICDEEVIFEDGESESVCDDDEDHYCEEIGKGRRNEREITKRMMELSATIGLKKMDDTSILDKAREYVEKLQERVKELEQEVGSNVCGHKKTKLNSDDYNCGTSTNDIILEVKAKVLQKEILIIIHCEKQNGVVLKILAHLENLHLSVVSSSVLRFGKSIFDITIIAQMGDGYNITVAELVKTLRIVILEQ